MKPPTDTIDHFSGPYRFLSNFYPVMLTWDGRCWPSAEHLYQARKTLDTKQQEQIRQATTPHLAKRLGRFVTLRPDWEGIKLSVMLEVLVLKFSNPEMAAKLLNTGNSQLIEGNSWGDDYWGAIGHDGEWKYNGRNHLGNMLMLVRSVLWSEIHE